MNDRIQEKATTRVCSNCRGEMEYLLWTHDYNCRTSSDRFTYLKCRTCGVVSIGAVPEDMGRFYPTSYVPYRAPSRSALDRASATERYKLDIVERFTRAGRLLDVGASWGGFAHVAKSAGFSVQTIEMDLACCDYLKTVVGVDVECSPSVVSAISGLGTFDVITMWHSIEHLDHPFEVLDASAAHLTRTGVLVVATPNPESTQFRVLGSHWVHLDAPRHLNLIPLSALCDRLERQGLELVYVTQTDWAGLVLNRMGWQSSFANMAERGAKRFMARATGRLVADVMVHVDSRSGRGAAYTAVFAKKARN